MAAGETVRGKGVTKTGHPKKDRQPGLGGLGLEVTISRQHRVGKQVGRTQMAVSSVAIAIPAVVCKSWKEIGHLSFYSLKTRLESTAPLKILNLRPRHFV